MVYDYYRPQILPWQQPFGLHVPPPAPPAPVVDEAAVRRILDAFRRAEKAARTVDELTGQPDCEDPDKAQLEKRVAELERQLEALQVERLQKFHPNT